MNYNTKQKLIIERKVNYELATVCNIFKIINIIFSMIDDRNRVSVLVTFYNQQKYVDKALSSVLAQVTDFGVKIIIGDDGSTDGTIDRINNWIEKYPEAIELHVIPRNVGNQIPGFRASRNRINLLKYVNTDYFIFLDGDDYFCNNIKLQKQVEILDFEANKDCVACGHNTVLLFENGTKANTTDISLKESKISPKEYWKKHYMHTNSLLFRSSIIPKININLLANNFNDNMITFSAISYGNIYYIPESWAVYIQTNNGIWTSNNQLINLIRNMIFYDLSYMINPKLISSSICRFSYLWKDLYNLRKSIDSTKLTEYAIESESKGCKNAYKWINYNNLSLFDRSLLIIKGFLISQLVRFLRHLP